MDELEDQFDENGDVDPDDLDDDTDIAFKLGVSKQAVGKHVARIRVKLNRYARSIKSTEVV